MNHIKVFTMRLFLILLVASWIGQSYAKTNLFLLMGLTRESSHWPLTTQEKFKAALPGVNLVFLDLPGSGKYYKKEASKNLEDYVEFLRSENKQYFNGNDRNIFLATSLAGTLAAHWSILHPKDFDGLILLSTTFGGVCKTSERAKPSVWPLLINIYLSSNIEAREKLILLVNSNKAESRVHIPRYVEIQKKRPMTSKNIKNQTFAGKNYELKANIPIPKLLLGSKQDKLVALECLKKTAKKINAPLCLHETSGHGLPIDDLDWVVKKASEWILGESDCRSLKK